MSFRISVPVSALALSGVLIAGPTVAEPRPAAPAVELAQAVMQEEPDLGAYAAATVKILQIQESMNEQMNAAGQEGDASRIQAEAQAAMVAAIEGEGLTVQQFNAISQLTQTDAEVSNTVEGLIRRLLGG